MAKSSYASFNTLTITGRVSHAELVDGKYGEFLAVTLLTELKDETPAVAVQFNNTNGLLSLYKGGYLNNGRSVTVTGPLRASLSSTSTRRLARLVASSVLACSCPRLWSLTVAWVLPSVTKLPLLKKWRSMMHLHWLPLLAVLR